MSRTIAIVGGGFTGLSAALDLARAGLKVSVYEHESFLGGLAGCFEIAPGCSLEKFYHHWFTSDRNALDLVEELGLKGRLHSHATNTGLYYANSIFRLASPLDLLSFKPISFISRIRTGLMALRARAINDFKTLEDQTAEEWIIKNAGRESYEVIWRPLLEGKFGAEAKNISAVWFWNKLKLRGSSRGETGEERLYYLDRGFQTLIDALKEELKKLGAAIYLNSPVSKIKKNADGKFSLILSDKEESFDAVLVTTPIPTYLQIVEGLPAEYMRNLSEIRYLGNICLILGMDRSLSSTYWLNIADPTFPFVGIIEHTNFEPPENYGGMHVVYLSKYLSTSDERYSFNTEELFKYALPFIKRMFPDFSEDWVKVKHAWKEPFSQPVIVKHYSSLIPPITTPHKNLFLATMAQVYPEDRGTSYAIRGGRDAALEILKVI